MTSRTLLLELNDDVVLSESGATTGGHRTLDYIPGATLLGAVARAIYSCSGVDAWTLFHSGKVRFGNGLPLSQEGYASVPLPLSLYQPKSRTPAADESLSIFNLAHGSRAEVGVDDGVQLKQCRGGYLTLRGDPVRVDRVSRLKTAIQPDQGRAAESQLFGYESLRAGQRFFAVLSWDADVPREQVDFVLKVFQSPVFLGRSRSAQYGRVTIQVLDSSLELPSTDHPDRVVMMALSDWALMDAAGQPLLTPEPEALGLTHAELIPELCHVRTRSYSPYNAWRKSYDMQRQVIVKGSVMVFRKLPGFDSAVLDNLAQGVGRYRESGLGQIWVNPALLAGTSLTVVPAKPLAAGASPLEATLCPSTPLIRWLSRRADRTVLRKHDDALLEGIEEQLAELYRTARNYAGLPSGQTTGPGKTQWGNIASLAATSDTVSLMEKLFGKGDPLEERKEAKNETHLCKRTDKAWGVETFHDGERTTFRKWLVKLLRNNRIRDTSYFARRLAEIACGEVVMKARDGMEQV